ncbi:MAG TPA: hypothetical protein VFO25_05095 [Candidatus Eremiobacteraceae bacterium]|nr:hypothetical protein [Candidatus Eremiobacteraceae bacterium]
MRVTRIGYALGVAAAVAVFAGCSGNGSSLGSVAQSPTMGGQAIVRNHPASVLPSRYLRAFPQSNQVTGHNWQSVKPNANTTYVIGCQFFSGFCNMYVQNHNTVVGQIFESYVNGLCQDNLGNVYIPDGGAQTVSVYAHGSTTAFRTLAAGDGNQPSTCTVGNNGTVYVGDITAAEVAVYPAGHNSPTRFISVPDAVSGFVGGVSVDELPSRNNLAVSFEGAGGVGVDTFTHAKGSGSRLVNTTGLAGVVYDKNENLVLTDDGLGEWEVYNGSFCNAQLSTNGGDAIFSTLNHPNTRIISGDFVNSELISQTYAFCTGGGTNPKIYTGFVSGDDVEGVAMSPGQTN